MPLPKLGRPTHGGWLEPDRRRPNGVGGADHLPAGISRSRRCSIALTSRRFRPLREVGPRFDQPFRAWEEAGWWLRAASPRNFVCWRRSWLLTQSSAPVAVFPDDQFELLPAQRAALSLFELQRRVTRVWLLANNLPPASADEPELAALLQRGTLRRLFKADPDPDDCRRLFAGLELKVCEAVAGTALPGAWSRSSL
jgi:hypothetical protein